MQGVPSYPPPLSGNRQAPTAAASVQQHQQQAAAEPMVYVGGGAYYQHSAANTPGSTSPISGNYELVYGDAVQHVQAGTPVSVQYDSKVGGYPVLQRTGTAQGYGNGPFNQPVRPSNEERASHSNWRGWATCLLNGLLYPVTVFISSPRVSEDELFLENLERFVQYEESIENELDLIDREERHEAWERIAGFEEESVKLAAIQAEVARAETNARKIAHRRDARMEHRNFVIAEKKKKDRLFRAYNIMRVISVASIVCLYVSVVGKPCFRIARGSGGSKRMLEDTSAPAGETVRKVFVRKA